MATAALLLGVSAMVSAPSAGAVQGRDLAASSAYVRADYQLISSAVAKIPSGQAAIDAVLHGAESGCPRAAAGSPQNAMSTQMSYEVIGALVVGVVQRGIGVARRFVRAASGIRWSDGRLTRQIEQYVSHVRTLAQLAPPQLCADVRAWAASGFLALPASTAAFDARFIPAWVGAGELPSRLARYEDGPTRALERRARALEERFIEFEAHAVETWDQVMGVLALWP